MYLKLPLWVIKTYNYILRTRMYLLVPLAGLTISNYVKDFQKTKLTEDNKGLTETVNALVTNHISRAGIIEQTDLIFWVKELVGEDYVIVYISPAYQQFLPYEMNRYQLLGRTGKYYNQDFGEVYQRNDKVAHRLSEPKIFREPYREYGTGPILAGDFLKGKVNNEENRKLVFGVFIRKSKNQNLKFN